MIRIPAVAGHFYPEEPEALERMVDGFLTPTVPGPLERVVALMVPHAGLIYSGRVAGATYSRVEVPPCVVLLGPNHTGLGPALSVWDRGKWEMPGSAVEVDEELCARLKRHCPGLVSDRAAHVREHCLEVQIPFLRAKAEDLRIAPVVVGTSRLEDLQDLGLAVARAVRESGGEVLVVISSDMTHYEPAEVAARKDGLALERLRALDAEGLRRIVREEGISMCGFAPAVSGLYAARELGARDGRLVRYGHSGEVSGDHGSVVGYAGMVFS